VKCRQLVARYSLVGIEANEKPATRNENENLKQVYNKSSLLPDNICPKDNPLYL